MAKYIILIYEDETYWAKASQDTRNQIIEEHAVFGRNNGAVLRGGDPVNASNTAVSLRKDYSGGITVTHRPFVEMKEAFCGYYLIEVANMDEALVIAKQIPLRSGGMEVRPIRVMD